MIHKSVVVTSQVSLGMPPNASKDAAFKTDVFLQRMVEACASNLAVLDESGKILYASRAWRVSGEQNALSENPDGLGLKHFGTDSESSVTVFPQTDALAEDIRRILDNRQREFHREYSCSGSRGARWFLVHAARLDLPESGGFRILLTREDTTRRRQAEEELRNLGGRLIKAQEEERSRVARELHDNLSQRMAILAIELDQLRQKIPKSQAALTVHVEQLWTNVQEISSEIHQLSYRLHPSKLDHLGLAAALESLCEELSQHQEIEIEFQQHGFPAILPQDITLCVFRIVQESLRNVIKHSGARDARVVLKKTTQAIHLRVSDSGCGFDIESPESTKGLGFVSMRERLRLVGGHISIRSQPSRGTHIAVLVPLNSRQRAVVRTRETNEGTGHNHG
ncbi:MAG: PAS domain-containing sensor histidine kinase [Pyrinomonadaceae bacterium]|nr:PAS domain-containing sensor histidine kinase [Pyrinomonadaceae bacterium]